MVGAAALLRPVERERERPEQAGGRLLDAIGFVVALSVVQSGTYVLLLAVGYEWDATAPVFAPDAPVTTRVVDPVVQAMTLTDIVVSATVTALLLALTIQIEKRFGTVDPDELRKLKG
ncbi:sodium:proton antiporter [Microtetraspora fusca]|uniref:sodium:proton antiporter n=1 Tax=Microtetraspora fusca TaxID=1997 RepID=UPI000A9DC522|nr:sodium:proton antiporter [Microtetraspora fusca]